jgi:hypothetical protein
MPQAPTGTFSGTQNAVRIPDGRVIIVESSGEGAELSTPVQVYDPSADEFTLGPSLPSPRHDHRIALLDDGRVLILGGWGADARLEADNAFIYDPASDAIVVAASLNHPRLAPLVVTLADGRVLVVGSQCWNQGCYGLGGQPVGAISAEIFR